MLATCKPSVACCGFPGRAHSNDDTSGRIFVMRASLGWLGLALGFAWVPVAGAGAIYKSTLHGSIVYQDQPCSTNKPDQGKLVVLGAQSDDTVTGSSPAEVMQ